MANAHLQNLLNKEISRKEFLGLSLLAAGSLFGIGSLIKLLTGKSLTGTKRQGSNYRSDGYGR